MGSVNFTKSALSLVLVMAGISHQMSAQEVGEYGFLEIPVSTRAAALGGTAISVVEPEVALADQNPALLCPEMAGQVSLSFINYVSDINLGYASYAGRFLSYGAWAGAVRFVDYGSFVRYDDNGVQAGTFSAKDISMSGSVGYPLNDQWNIGGTLRAIYTKYESYGAFAIGVDVGTNYYSEETGTSFSAVVTNLGGQLASLYDRYQHLPTQMAVGFSKELEHLPVCVSLSAIDLFDWDRSFVKHVVVGAEWIISDNIYFAGGYNFRHFSVGGGLKYRNWNLQLAYARYNSLDGSLNLGLTYRINNK